MIPDGASQAASSSGWHPRPLSPRHRWPHLSCRLSPVGGKSFQTAAENVFHDLEWRGRLSEIHSVYPHNHASCWVLLSVFRHYSHCINHDSVLVDSVRCHRYYPCTIPAPYITTACLTYSSSGDSHSKRTRRGFEAKKSKLSAVGGSGCHWGRTLSGDGVTRNSSQRAIHLVTKPPPGSGAAPVCAPPHLDYGHVCQRAPAGDVDATRPSKRRLGHNASSHSSSGPTRSDYEVEPFSSPQPPGPSR